MRFEDDIVERGYPVFRVTFDEDETEEMQDADAGVSELACQWGPEERTLRLFGKYTEDDFRVYMATGHMILTGEIPPRNWGRWWDGIVLNPSPVDDEPYL